MIKDKKFAKKEINELFEKAKEHSKNAPEKAKDFVRKARRIAMHYRLRISKQLKRVYCKKCNSYLITGFNSTVRISKGKVIIKCLRCKNLMKIGF